MKKLILSLALIASLSGCVSPESAHELLEQQNYKDITITGYAPLSCSEDDFFRTGFKATAPNGDRVSGTVCGGFFKGSTIRFD